MMMMILLIILLTMLIIGIVIPIFNMILSLVVKRRFKLPIPKRFRGKATPIYKLTDKFHGCQSEYFVSKYELKYEDFDFRDGDNWRWFIPFMFLFNIYRYSLEYQFSIGKVSEIDVASLDIGTECEFRIARHKMLERKEKEKEAVHQYLIDKVNEKFNQNYTK